MPGASHPTYQQCLQQVLLRMEGLLACGPALPGHTFPLECVCEGEGRGEPGHCFGGGLGLLLQCPESFLKRQPRLQSALTTHNPWLKIGEGALASTFFLPLRLGRPSPLGALGHAGSAGVSWRLTVLHCTSRGTSAESLRVLVGWSAAAARGLAWSWPWQGCS